MRKHYQHDPIPPFETRYPDRLESVIGTIHLSAENGYIKNNILNVAASYFNHFARGQVFLNGNKRAAVMFTHLFLLVHEIELSLTDKEMFNFAAVVAKGSELEADMEKTNKLCVEIIGRYTREKRNLL